MMTVDNHTTERISNFYRSPQTVMNLARMGSAHQCRLSFMRTLLRRIKREQWQFARTLWEIDALGVGRAVYQIKSPSHTYSLVAFAHDLPDELRSDRVIAEAWDATFTLFDGIPTESDLQRLIQQVPKQEAGHVSHKELCLSRANKSVRLFDAVVHALAAGQQPDRKQIEQVGYLMRTTAVYAAGKFGTADRDLIQHRQELTGPFQAEMITVWLIRTFVLELVEHLAAVKGGKQAVALQPDLRRCIGVGNSTGLGMAPFLINHPKLLNNWIVAREEALARVRIQSQTSQKPVVAFLQFVERAMINAEQWQSQHPIQQPKLTALRADLKRLFRYLQQYDFSVRYPWDVLYRWGEQQLSLEGQEQLAMLMLEPFGELIDDLTSLMSTNEQALFLIDASLSVQTMSQWLHTHYDWALAMDFSSNASRGRFWYVSEEKLEPRVGERFEEPGMELEQPLCVAWHISQFAAALSKWNKESSLATFLSAHPEFRHVARRAQLSIKYPYMEIRDNLISAEMMPIDLLRLKLSFFGATKFDPRSDRWVRITMFQNAPFPQELATMPADDWAYPPLAEAR